MKDLIGYCGLDCEKCGARIATIKDDDKLREETAKLWTELNGFEITKDMINCLGCKGAGLKTYFCDQLCEIRRCAEPKQYNTCGECSEWEGCEKLKMITDHSEEALANLK